MKEYGFKIFGCTYDDLLAVCDRDDKYAYVNGIRIEEINEKHYFAKLAEVSEHVQVFVKQEVIDSFKNLSKHINGIIINKGYKCDN